MSESVITHSAYFLY